MESSSGSFWGPTLGHEVWQDQNLSPYSSWYWLQTSVPWDYLLLEVWFSDSCQFFFYSGFLTPKMGFFYSSPNYPGIIVFTLIVRRLYSFSEPAKQGNNNNYYGSVLQEGPEWIDMEVSFWIRVLGKLEVFFFFFLTHNVFFQDQDVLRTRINFCLVLCQFFSECQACNDTERTNVPYRKDGGRKFRCVVCFKYFHK